MLRHKRFITPLLLLLTQSALALNLQGYKFSDSYRYSLLDDSLHENFDGKYIATASYGFVHSPFYYSDTYLHDMRKEIIDSNNILTVGGSYFLNDRVSLGVDLNAVHNTVFNDTRTTLADTVLKSRINLKRTEDFSFSINPQVIIPTGQTENFTTMNSVGGALSAVAEKSFNKLHLLASVGALSAKNNYYADVDHRQLLLSQLGISYDVSDKMNVNLEAYRNFPLVNDTLQDDGKYFLTAKHKTGKRFSTYFGAGVTALNEVQRNSYSGFFGIKFHEPVAAADAVSTGAAAPVRANFESVYFEHNRANLKEEELSKLENYVEGLKGMTVTVEGHASRPGTDAYNMKLSERRANFVKKYLVEKGVEPDSLTVEAFGESQATGNDNEDRRVKLNIKY